jgi:hypothetical protein
VVAASDIGFDAGGAAPTGLARIDEWPGLSGEGGPE